MSEHKKIKLSDLKEHISCYLCKGYLIEANTIIECLHTFCKTCIVKYLKKDNNNTCPKCGNVIHQSHPLQYISFDRTMQDIVYKLVPNLDRPKDTSNDNNNNISSNYNSENKIKGSDGGNKLKPIDTNGQQQNKTSSTDYHREDEQINIHLIPHPSCDLRPLKNKYIRISCLATVTLLKKYIATKIFNDIERYKELDLLCNDNLLGKDHNFKFVSVTEWRDKTPPVKITYKPRSDD